MPFRLDRSNAIRLGLRNPDLTTARRIAEAINRNVGAPIARATDPRTVALVLSARDVIDTLARIEDLMVEPDSPAVVVIDEASGTIVMGANVRVSTVAIAQGNLTIRVTETPQVSQPGPLSNGQTTTVPRTTVQVDDQHDRKLGILQGGVTLRDLVASLNALGVGPRELILLSVSSMRVKVSCAFADPTVMALGSMAGDPMAPNTSRPSAVTPALPAATTTTIPLCHADSTA